jgi:enoyl-CoA hydratase
VYDFEYVHVEVEDGGLTTARFLDPPAGEPGMRQLDEVCELFHDLARDPRVRVVVLLGGEQRFFTGPDLAAVLESRADADAVVQSMLVARTTVHNIIAFERPLIAAVNGAAFGLGTQVALLSDIVVAGRSAYFQDPHVKMGVAAGDGGAAVWPLVLGLGRAKRYMLTGQRLPATVAYEAGAVAELVDDGREEEVARDIATEFLPLPDLAVRLTKSALNQWLRLGALTAFDYAFAAQLATALTPESTEILRAAAKRAAERQQ